MYYHRFYTLSPFKPRSVEFNVWSTEDVKKLSVTAIHTHICFDGLNYPIVGGLYDPRLGPIKSNSDPCATCGNNLMKCSGHYGHIDLPFPVFNPLFSAIVANVLKISCLNCHTIMIPDIHKQVLIAQLKLIDHGYLIEVHELDNYLEEFSYKQSHQVKADMDKMCKEIFSKPPDNQCKSADILWRRYVSKIFKIGSAAKTCLNCPNKIRKITFQKDKLYIESEKDSKLKTYLMPLTAKEHLRKLWKQEADFLKALINVLSASNEEYPTDVCFTEAVLVTPSNTRPAQIIRQKLVEHVKNNIYKLILQDCLQIRSIMQMMQKNNSQLSKEVEDVVNTCKGGTINEKLQNASQSLQTSVNSLLDSKALRSELNDAAGVDKIGLKQLIEKKQGILRKNMMGKRVDYFARSVITPDPLLNVDEIGVPETFAKKLTFPVPVTPWNVTKLRRMVLNGPDIYPGANVVESDDGFVTRISGTNSQSRQGLAKTLLTPGVDSKGPKIVHRHLLNGDVLLLNRQPSLHKPSIMAHKARILKGEKTFRLHYANCKAYNADFDGDEMNAHFPQGELARAEAAEIVNVANQYLVPRDGTPLSGLIQDHVVSGVRLSIRGKFFDRSDYHYLVFQALNFLTDDIVLLPPAMLKPKQLWSGKQVISTIIMNLTPKNNAYINLNSTAKISYNAWPRGNNNPYLSPEECKFMSESNVIIKDGELLSGILDKNHVGATHYGLIHCFYELYGGQASTNLLGAFSKLFTSYLQKDGFTLGVTDILVKNRPDRKRTKLAEEIKLAGIEAAKNALDIPPDKEIDESDLNQMLESAYKNNSNFRALVDHHYKLILDQYTNKINKICLPVGLLQPFPQNNLQLMVQSGAKGSTVNTMQISCLLGQIELEGKRPPLMISGRSLPSFRPYDPSPMAGGFINSRFMTGIQPQEFFFHCMAGREGLIDTAVKTSRSGYLQRCLVKHLEGLIINYDLTVRDSDNSVIQFRYGEDGLDISKSQMLKKDRFEFLSNNLNAFHDKKVIKDLKLNSDRNELKKRKTSIQCWIENEGNYVKKKRNSGFLRFCQEVNDDIPRTNITKSILGRDLKTSKLCHIWSTMLHDDTKKKYQRMIEKCPDPVLKDFQPDVHFGSITEKLESMIDEYLDSKNKENLPFKSSKFKEAIYLKSFSSLCHPGEAVGVLAAQSVGEPSTQMTLNTFHFAGRGEMNVTLGIPRLREILTVASKKIKTPSMEIPFKQDVLKLEKKAEKLRKSLTRVVLKDVLEKVEIKESIRLKDQPIRIYKLLFHHLPKKSYSNNTNVDPERILNYLQSKFLVRVMQLLKKHLKMNYNRNLINSLLDKSSMRFNLDESMGNATASNENVNGSDESDINSDIEGDGDATEAKLKSRRYDFQEYDEDEDEKSEKEEEEDEYEEKPGELNIPEDSDDENDSEVEDHEETEDNKSSVTLNTPASQSLVRDYGIKDVRHDTDHFSWTEVTLWTSLKYKRIDLSSLIPKLAESAVIHEVRGIKRAIVSHNKEGVLMLKTEGSYGIWELFKHDRLLDLNKLYSNDVQAVAETYGIEAANNVIVREVQNVFQVYGITVDPRHLSLIADYMTFDGNYQPLNRTGMDNCPSPLQQMTFESTLKYLKNATIRKIKDNLHSPSSSLIVGQESKIGSGLMKLFWK